MFSYEKDECTRQWAQRTHQANQKRFSERKTGDRAWSRALN